MNQKLLIEVFSIYKEPMLLPLYQVIKKDLMMVCYLRLSFQVNLHIYRLLVNQLGWLCLLNCKWLAAKYLKLLYLQILQQQQLHKHLSKDYYRIVSYSNRREVYCCIDSDFNYYSHRHIHNSNFYHSFILQGVTKFNYIFVYFDSMILNFLNYYSQLC